MKENDNIQQQMQNWWSTSIIDMSPGSIRFRGYNIQELIGNVTFSQMLWLMTRGTLPTKEEAALLEAALVAGVDHGPQAPSIAISRMAMSCGVGINNAMASAINTLGDIHGGAGEQALELYYEIDSITKEGISLTEAVKTGIEAFQAKKGKYIPGFGHRFHPVDPRSPRLLQLVKEAAQKDIISGHFVQISKAIENQLEQQKGKKIPLNIDGATAVIYAELGFAAPLARGLFCISRSVGILAHAWEQKNEETRNKGPIPRQYIWSYRGEPERSLNTIID